MVKPIPDHLRTVTPRLAVPGGDAIDFYARAFGAEQVGDVFSGPEGELIHVEIRIGDSVVMLTGESESALAPGDGPVTAIMATYWEDVDAAWERALAAGAEVIHPLADQFYGERGGRVRDPFGHHWMLSQVIEDVSREEMERRAAQIFDSAG
jgi:PhnB protein